MDRRPNLTMLEGGVENQPMYTDPITGECIPRVDKIEEDVPTNLPEEVIKQRDIVERFRKELDEAGAAYVLSFIFPKVEGINHLQGVSTVGSATTKRELYHRLYTQLAKEV